MSDPALRGEVSKIKMLKLTNPKFERDNDDSIQLSRLKLFTNQSDLLAGNFNVQELNLIGNGDSSQNLKVWVSSPSM